MIKFKNIRALTGLSSLIAIAATSVAACSPASREESVEPRVELVDRTSQALSSGLLKWANGTYGAGCTNRMGSWSVHIGADTSVMTNPALSVLMNDTGCVLTLTGLEADDTYVGTPSIAMGTTYAATASSFAPVVDSGPGPLTFYANAKLDSVSFASNFAMTILFSNSAASASACPPASSTFASVSATASESQVVAPDYTVGLSGVTIQTDVNDVVQSATGSVTTTAIGQTGEFYVISTNQSLGSTFAAMDAEYALGTPAAVAASIAVSDFALVGETLPKIRNLILTHTVSGVTAYRVIQITFNAP